MSAEELKKQLEQEQKRFDWIAFSELTFFPDGSSCLQHHSVSEEMADGKRKNYMALCEKRRDRKTCTHK